MDPTLSLARHDSVVDLHFLGPNPKAKFMAINEQTDHNVMHLDRFGKADRLAHQSFDPGARRQVLPPTMRR
jgi:hypothetical protein